MPQLGKHFGSNGDYFGFWDYNQEGLDQTVGLPTTGGVRPRGDSNAPMIGGGGMPSVDSYPLPKALRERLKRGTIVAGLGEDDMCGTVSLRRGKLNIEYDTSRSTIFKRIKDTFDKMAAQTGKKIYTPKTPITVHPTGGACLGTSIDNGVVGADGQVFDNPGLYVADAAALPRAPGGPPSMTIAAWSDHLATEFIARHKPR
jgi:cholesterol oxidase